MPSVNPYIEAIADQDPVMRELLGHSAYFLYKDWQLFRERKPLELVRSLERRAGGGFLGFSVLTVLCYRFRIQAARSASCSGVASGFGARTWVSTRSTSFLAHVRSTSASPRRMRSVNGVSTAMPCIVMNAC